MKLIALKKLSARLPKGAAFDESRSGAKMLIALGFAKAADEEPEPRSKRTYRRRDLQAEGS